MSARKDPQRQTGGTTKTRNGKNIPVISQTSLEVKNCAACMSFFSEGGAGVHLRGQCLRTSERLNAPLITGCDLWRSATGHGGAA